MQREASRQFANTIEQPMYTVQARCITQNVPKGHVSDRAVERFGGYFLRLAPLGSALDKDAANGGFAGLFPRGGPDVFSFALFINPRDDLGSGGKHVAFRSRFYLDVCGDRPCSRSAILGSKSGGGLGITITCGLFELY